MKLCPTCGRAWIPLGEEPAECPACRHAIGMCALVGGRIRAVKPDHVVDSDEMVAAIRQRMADAAAKEEP